MTCVALKRSAPFDSIGSASVKRHRCSLSLPCNCQLTSKESIFTPSSHLTKDQIHRRIRHEVWRLQRRRIIPKFPPYCLPSFHDASDTYNERPSSPDECALQSCSQVISGMRQMAIRSPKPDSPASSDSDETSDGSCTPPHTEPSTSMHSSLQQSPSSAAPRSARISQDTVPLFTMCQVTALCDRLIREREEQLREEYDNILCCKLAEQYTALLKFNQDQLSYRFKDAPMSYVS